MHQAPFEERLDFYRYRSASIYLDQARALLAELKTSTRHNTVHWKYSSLWLAFYVSYGKPFKQQWDKELKRGLRLPDDVVPAEWKERHQLILDLRDKMFAHTDWLSLRDKHGNPLNMLTAFIQTDGDVVYGMSFNAPEERAIDESIAMIDEIRTEVMRRGDAIWATWAPHITVPEPGAWNVNAGTDTDDVFIPVPTTTTLPDTVPLPVPI